MTARPRRRRLSSAVRRGSALILVLVMTLSLAGLAVSAVLLTSSSSLVQRYYDKAKDYRLYALSAIGLVKSAVQRDTTVSIPGDTAYRALTASTITDALGATNTGIRVNAYAAYTGDTAGTYIPFLSIMAQAYDTLGVKSVQRLDLQSESFSRYSMFVDSFPSAVALEVGQHLHGRVHGNRNWVSSATSPGPDYYDTVSVVGSVSGTASYHGITAVTAAKRIKWPDTTSLLRLQTLASAGSLGFAPVSGTSIARCSMNPTLVDLSGHDPTAVTNCFTFSGFGFGYTGGFSFVNVAIGSRLRFRPVDVNNNGSYDAAEGFVEVFDLAAGIDTGSLRVDMPKTATGSITNIVTLNQCGLMATISGKKQFFPVARFREHWVLALVRGATTPTITDADTTIMRVGDAAAVTKVLSYGVGYSRCFPAGSPWLMLAERYVNNTGAGCQVTTNTSDRPYGWGATAGGCVAAQQYGGQDTTFTAVTTRCYMSGSAGLCDMNQIWLGTWRAFAGTSTAAPPASVVQAVEKPYLWPISSTYNAASRGVIYSSAGPLYVGDTLRGYATLYVKGAVTFINDIVYDKDPLDSAAMCRNMLGIISSQSMRIANNALNYPRADPGTGGAGTFRFLGSPNFTLNAMALSMTSAVGVEDSTIALVTSPATVCNGTNTSGGCLNHTGSAIMKLFRPTHAAAGTGLIRNNTQDPCQSQATNRRPPFFPLTGRYVEYKWLEADPRITSTWTQIKTYLARLRGTNRAVP